MIVNHDFPVVSVGFGSGGTQNYAIYDYSDIQQSFNSGSLSSVVTIVTASFDSASVYQSFYTGSVTSVVTIVTASFDSASVYQSFNVQAANPHVFVAKQTTGPFKSFP